MLRPLPWRISHSSCLGLLATQAVDAVMVGEGHARVVAVLVCGCEGMLTLFDRSRIRVWPPRGVIDTSANGCFGNQVHGPRVKLTTLLWCVLSRRGATTLKALAI